MLTIGCAEHGSAARIPDNRLRPPGLIMQCQWYRLESTGLPRGVVVIDATLAAERHWDLSVPSILEELREKLPAEALPDVVFLGDRQSYPLSAILGPLLGDRVSVGSIEPHQQLGRFPVVGPFFREWMRTSPRPVALITNSPVYDLDDWAASDLITALLVYRLIGSDRLTQQPFREIDSNELNLGVLVEHLRDPLVEVRVGGNGVFSVDWHTADLIWENGILRGSGSAANTMQLCLVHPDEHRPLCELRRASGTIVKIPLTPTSPHATTEPIPVPEAEAVMRYWRSGQPFHCSECPVPHAPGQLWCKSGPGKAIMKSLSGYPHGTVWTLKRPRNWIAFPSPNRIAILEDKVVVNRGTMWEAYSIVDGQWNLTDPPDLLIHLGENEFVFPG